MDVDVRGGPRRSQRLSGVGKFMCGAGPAVDLRGVLGIGFG